MNDCQQLISCYQYADTSFSCYVQILTMKIIVGPNCVFMLGGKECPSVTHVCYLLAKFKANFKMFFNHRSGKGRD